MLSFRFNGYMKGGPRLDGIRKSLKINKYIDTLINEKALRETLVVVRWSQKFLHRRRPPSRRRGTAKI